MHAHFQMFARYNAWANARLYAAAGALSDAQYRADRGAFFKSVHGTLNHLLTTDRIWVQRLTGNAASGTVPDRLDAILFEDFAGLQAARVAEDARLTAYIDTLDAAALAGMLAEVEAGPPEVARAQVVPTEEEEDSLLVSQEPVQEAPEEGETKQEGPTDPFRVQTLPVKAFVPWRSAKGGKKSSN